MQRNVCLFLLVLFMNTSRAVYDRPKIHTESGNLILAPTAGSDISFFVENGGKLLLGKTDISEMIDSMNSYVTRLEQCSVDSKSALSKISQFEGEVNSTDFITRLNNLEKTTNTTNRLVFLVSRPMRRRINMLQKRLAALLVGINRNECESSPCQHGGTCQDLYNSYTCLCPRNWEGVNCEKDVNECEKFQGTELGCQNNAKCINSVGSYECKCTEGWYGIHCTKQTQDCINNAEICGHGTCIPLANGYKCLCDQGWKTDGTKQACTVDVNECDSYHPPCSPNPPVKCINLPGTFYCGHCPPGYTGNGFYCSDINECEILNGGCSMYPMVQCLNVPGSRICGRCPSGYSGDGATCIFQGVCAIGNGGCHPMAQCRDNPRISSTFVECVCPSGYSGDGYGPTGCIKGTIDVCNPNPCQHGTCTPKDSSYRCTCTSKYTGRYCEIRKDACFSNPCQNGGTCKSFAFSFYCSCPIGFGGPYCQNNMAQCGQVMGPNGNLTYPPAEMEFNRNSQISCAVRIRTKVEKVFNLTIHGVYLPSCSHNYLQIHDGKDTGAPLIGRFCDNELKNGSYMYSTTDTMYIWMKGDALAPKPFINISWKSIDPVCGGLMEVNDPGTFKSPGSPQKYPPKRDCYWKLRAPLNKRIKFTFYHLDIGNNTDCTNDFLSFNEGLEPSEKFFFKRCKTGIIEPIMSPSNEVTVHLHTVGSYTGFLIHYILIEGPSGCGGIYTHFSGTISRHTMSNELDIVNCEYKIQLPFKTRIKLRFNSFKGLPESKICTDDAYTIAIYKGDTINSPLVGRYCGTTKFPPDLIILDSQALIVYKTNPDTNFELEYKPVCGGTYTGESATIQSDNYPNLLKIEEPIECIYTIILPPNNRIEIDFTDLDIGSSTNWNCQNGYLDIEDGEDKISKRLRHYCTGKPDETLYSTSNVATIKYVARFGSVRGFSLKYKALGDSECGGLKTDEFGFVKSPRDLQSYEKGLNCTWTLSAPPGNLIQLNWLSFNLEDSYNCLYDYVQVFDNITSDDIEATREMGKFCGNHLPPTMTTSSNIATVFFKIDPRNNFDGFYLTYRFISVANICGGHFFAPSGIMRSPSFPLPYQNNRNCIWIITAPAGQLVRLNFTAFELENSENCRYDYVQVLNGGSVTSPLIGKYCGKKLPSQIVSHTNQLYVQFVSDKTNNGPGFEIKWSSTATGCGGTLTSPRGSIMSPNYPEPYGRNAECFWKIAVSHGSKVQAVFGDLELEYLHGCYLDYVVFYDGIDTMSKKIGTFCRLEGNNPLIVSSGNHLTIKFHSDINHQGRGFQLQYTTICKTNLTGFGGVIENPNYPEVSPKDLDCAWQINVPEGNKINLTVSHFSIEDVSLKQCERTYMEIQYQDDNYEMQSIGKFCNNNTPDEEIQIKSNQALILFHSGHSYMKTIFRIEWELFGCGGILTRESGSIQTPNYPNQYPLSTKCNWHIQTEFGKSIEIVFDNIDMELNRNCDMDFIKVFNGADDTYPEIARFCHINDKPLVITSTGREMYITFVSDISYSGKGFKANYKSLNAKCGGRLTASSGALHSPNYPNNHDRNDTCEWLIEVPENHLIELVFDNVDLLNVCESTYIKVYDGPTAAYPLLQRICGTIIPDKIISRTNHLYIELVTHALLTTKGFFARYSTACGALIKTQGSGMIDYSARLLTATNITNCSYTIVAENPEQHVLLTFSKYQNSVCYFENHGGLAIYDGETRNSSLVGVYCQKMPGLIRSAGNKIHIEIPESATDLSFTVKYSVVESSCGGEYSAESGEFSSPGYPNNYPVDAQCEWKINVGEGNEIMVDFTIFDLVQSDNCNEDYLEVRQVNSGGKLIGTFCGGEKPINVTAMGGIWLYFKSERPVAGAESPTAKGFLADFAISTFVQFNNQTRGTIVSPLYPENIMSQNQFKWQITVKEEYIIYFEFDDMDFSMGDSEYCYGGSITFSEPGDEFSIIRVICRASDPFKTSTNSILVTMQGMSPPRGSKFKLRWRQMHSSNATDPKCESFDTTTMVSHDTTVLEHTFLREGVSRKTCTWLFTTTPGRHLKVAFDYILSTSIYCILDAVQLFESSNLGLSSIFTSIQYRSLGIICNNTLRNRTFETSGEGLKVQHSVILVGTRRNMTSAFKINITDVCGGVVKKPNGVFNVQGPIEPKIGTHLKCNWTIFVPTGKRILIDVISDFTKTNDCESKAMIHNGHDKDSPVILTHCGNPSTTATITTTGNKAFITFIGNYTESLKIKFKSISTTECGSSIQLTDIDNSAIITSPNYPNAPQRYAECIWQISVPNGEAVRVDFMERFDLQKSIDCKLDGVEIRDGLTANSRLIGTYCSDMPGTLKSIGNKLYFHYYTNVVDPRNGFKANISIAFCGGTIRGNTGSITTPGYKHRNSYPTNVTCTWEILAPPGHSMNMTFDSFDIPVSAELTIVDADGFNNTEVLIYNYTYKFKPPSILQSGSNKVIVRLSTGKTSYSEGFKLSFVASAEKCGGVLTNPSGVITSSNYPYPSKAKQTCEWVIKVPQGRRVKLTFDDLDLNRGVDSNQGIACFSGHSFASNLLFMTEKDDYDKVVRSSDNEMQIYFWTYGNQLNRGFKATYTSDEPSVCNSGMDETRRQIIKPTEKSFTCTWKPKPPMTNKQTLAWSISTNLTGTPPTTCTYTQSSVLLSQGEFSKNIYAEVIKQFCKSTKEPEIVRTLLPYINIGANQRSDKNNIDFIIKYKVYDCGGEILDPDGFITTPKGYAECAWRLKGQEGEQYTLTVTDFNMDDCESSHLLVYNGRSIKDPLVGKYCGSNKPSKIQSQRHYFWIEYHGSNSSSLNMSFQRQSNICGGINHEQKSNLQSPSYPNSYDNNVECLWELRADNGYHIELQFTDRFQLEESDGCLNDFVSIYDQVIQETTSNKYCGRQTPPSFKSKGNLLYILFRTNSMVTGSGFKASWNWACGGKYNATETKQTIESPGYPHGYSQNLRCEYVIQAPRKFIKIIFEDFELEKSASCIYDRLQVGPTSFHTWSKALYCGNTPPKPMRMYSTLNLTFITDRWVTKKGFKFSYQIDSCGWNITAPTLIIENSSRESALATQYFSPMRTCNWNILAPKDKRIIVKFQQVNITYNSYCYSQYVAVFDDKGKKMAALCGDLSSDYLPTIHSNSNNIFLKFQFYNLLHRSADFQAFVDFVYGPETGCGGIINLTSTALQNIDFKPPGKNYDCIWHVQAGIDYIVGITFDVDAPSKAYNCLKDDNTVYATEKKKCCVFYEMRDGNTSLSDEIFSECDLKGNSPVRYTSSGSYAQLRIVGNVQSYKIPRISISRELSICGHLNLIPTNDTQYITTPSFPSKYPANIKCVWRIKTKFINAIHLRFAEFNLNSEQKNITDCGTMDRLELVDRTNKAFHLDYDLVWRRKPSKWEITKLDSLFGQHTFCSASDKFYEFVSTESNIQLSFYSNSLTPKYGNGFKIEYKIAKCSRNYTVLSGRIASMWQTENCTSRIIVPKNYTISLYFSNTHQFQVSCAIRWMEIYDASKPNTPMMKLCGMQQVQPVFSESNEIVIQWKNTMRYGMFTSDMTYVASDKGRGCGGDLYMFKGSFTSPMYPNPPIANILCRWTLRVPLGLQLAFNFKWFDIKGVCEENYVKITDNQVGISKAEQVYCSTDTPAIFVAPSGSLTLEYRSGPANTGSGWRAAFMAITTDLDVDKLQN